MWDSSKNSSPYENWTQADWNNWMPFEESPFDQLWFKVLLTICYGIVFAACVLGKICYGRALNPGGGGTTAHRPPQMRENKLY